MSSSTSSTRPPACSRRCNLTVYRKGIRLPAYDYSSEGAYFVTVCTDGKRRILSELPTVGADDSVRPYALSGPADMADKADRPHALPGTTVVADDSDRSHALSGTTVVADDSVRHHVLTDTNVEADDPVRHHVLTDTNGGADDSLRPTVPTILTPIGKIVEDCILSLPLHNHGIRLDKYVVMPNHIHLLLRFVPAEGGQSRPPLQKVMQSLKSVTTRECWQFGVSKLWQRSFYDHVIRNETDYLRIWQYIEQNPLRWSEDIFFETADS